jgi:hypothetical protein
MTFWNHVGNLFGRTVAVTTGVVYVNDVLLSQVRSNAQLKLVLYCVPLNIVRPRSFNPSLKSDLLIFVISNVESCESLAHSDL